MSTPLDLAPATTLTVGGLVAGAAGIAILVVVGSVPRAAAIGVALGRRRHAPASPVKLPSVARAGGIAA